METKKQMEIILKEEDVDKKIKEVAEKYRKTVSVKGFRPGKAPVDMVIAKYREEIENDAIESLTGDKVYEMTKENKFKIIPPVYIKGKVREGNNWIVKVEFEVIPDFDVTGYDNLPIQRRVKRVSPLDVEQRLKYYQETLAEFYPKEEGIEDGDFIQVKYNIFDEKGNILAKEKEEKFEFDEKNVAPIFYENLKGKKVGENVEIRTREGDKNYVYKVNVMDVRRKVLQEIDDEFAKSFDFENLEEFKNKIEKELQEEASRMAERDMENEILRKLLEINKFDIPESLVEDELNAMMDEYKIPQNEKGEFKEKFREAARERVRARLLLDKVAEKANFKVSQEEIDEEVRKMAKEYNADFLGFKANLKKRGILGVVERQILRRKAMDFLKSRVKTEVVIE